jgi:hypothetical protein
LLFKTSPSGKSLIDLMMYQVAQEGFIHHNSCILLYPSHLPGKVNEALKEHLPRIAYQLGSYCVKDTLIRWKPTLNKSFARMEGKYHKISFETEFNSLCLDIKRKINENTLIVVDDFTTSGLSFESARNILEKTEAERIVLCAIGKYTRPIANYNLYSVQKDFNAFLKTDKITAKDVQVRKKAVLMNSTAQSLIHEYFQRLSK